MLFSSAVDGFLLSLAAEGKSKHTVSDYRNSLRRLSRFLGPKATVGDVTTELAREFLASLDGTLAPKTRRNVHATMRSFWRWAVAEGHAVEQIMDGIRPPRAAAPLIEPFTEAEVRAMLKACRVTASWYSKRGGRDTATRRPTALRDRALLLFLLDTGSRASELCALKVSDVDLATGRAMIRRGKGGKPRQVSIGKRTRQAVWRYWTEREDLAENAPAFATVLDGERPLERRVLGRLCTRIGNRAGVAGAHPHRWRHTFAIWYIRNGGDIFTLQELLGHSTLDMVRRYARIAESDTERVHERASPVDNWRL